MKHFGDPCVHCLIPHDDISPGPCTGDPRRAVPIAWRSLGVRWDNVEHFLILMSNDEIVDRWEHIEFNTPYYGYLAGVRFDQNLRRRLREQRDQYDTAEVGRLERDE